MVRKRFLLTGVLTSALLAQAPADLFDKAPPDVDEALRERVGLFYQAHVDAKFRLADTVVHEDSKDAFFVAEKTQYKGFEIVRINYSDNFTKARVVTVVVTDFTMPGFRSTEARVPLTTMWKQDQGQWWWYVEPPKGDKESPFGVMKPGEGGDPNHPFAVLRKMPSIDEIRSQVSVNKTEVRLGSGEATDEVVVTNRMPGPVTLELEWPVHQGFEARLDQAELKGGESAKILFHTESPERGESKILEAKLRVMPTNHVIPIRVTLAGGAKGTKAPRQR
jgi:hypothetical protein